jgi:hypothetical protein
METDQHSGGRLRKRDALKSWITGSWSSSSSSSTAAAGQRLRCDGAPLKHIITCELDTICELGHSVQQII